MLRTFPAEKLTLQEDARSVPQEQKDRVHFFLINGLDPAYAGNLNGLAAYYRSLGFTNTTCYQFPAAWKVRRQIEQVRRSDPEARIVLLGYSIGANFARGVANSLARDNITIDCLVYVGGDTIFNTPSSRPTNVAKVVNITGHGLIFLGRDIYFKGEDIDGAVNHRVDARHITVPNQAETISLIGNQLITLANQPGAPATARTPSVVPPSVPTFAPASLAREPRQAR
jgi:hypothetical protein